MSSDPRLQWSGVDAGQLQMWQIFLSEVCACLCDLLAEGHAPPVIRLAEWCSVPADCRSKHLGTYRWFVTSEISTKTGFRVFPPIFFFVIFTNFLLFPALISLSSSSSGFRWSKHTKIRTERNSHSSRFWSDPRERWVDFNIDVHRHGRPITMMLDCIRACVWCGCVHTCSTVVRWVWPGWEDVLQEILVFHTSLINFIKWLVPLTESHTITESYRHTLISVLKTLTWAVSRLISECYIFAYIQFRHFCWAVNNLARPVYSLAWYMLE